MLSGRALKNIVIESREEVESRHALHLINGVHIVALGPVAALILIDKPYGSRRRMETEHHLEERLGHGDLVLAYRLVLPFVEDRPTHNE